MTAPTLTPSLSERLAALELEVGDLVESRRAEVGDFSRYATDPVGFVRDVLRDTDPGPWSAQVEIAEAVRDHPLVVVRSCNSAGKDWLAARLALWWVYARNGLALVTGPTERQVREIVMKQAQRAFHRARGLGGDMFTMALRLGTEERGILAFTSSEASRLTGFHAPRILAIITEAQAVEDWAYEGLLACATGPEDRVLAVGNPLVPSGRFYIASQSDNWHSIQVSAEDHPNVRGDKAVIPGGISPAFVARMAAEYGEGSGIYRSRVLGEFPDQGEEALFSRAWLEAAADRWDRTRGEVIEAAPVVACDPARYGPDATVVAVRRGTRLERFVSWRGKSTMDTAERLRDILKDEGVKAGVPPGYGNLPPGWREKLRPHGEAVVDVVGLGAGVLDRIKQWGYRAQGFNGGMFTNSMARKRFLNKRAEAYWHLRVLLEDGKIAIPRDEELFEELLALRWMPTPDGRVRMELKSDLKGRIGRSPDKSDALVMAFAAEMGRTFTTRVPSPWG